MTLSTHSVVGAGLALVTHVNPGVAFVIGFTSHFVLDAIPHWDYPMKRSFIALDVILSLLLVWFFFFPHSESIVSFFTSAVAWGAFGAVLPDMLMGLHMVFPTKLSVLLDRFHSYVVHSKVRLDHMKFVGPLLQGVFIAIVVVLSRYYAVI